MFVLIPCEATVLRSIVKIFMVCLSIEEHVLQLGVLWCGHFVKGGSEGLQKKAL